MKLVLLLGTDGADVRSAKLCNSLTKLGHEVHFVGWNRHDTAKRGEMNGIHYHLLSHEVPMGRSTLWAQVKFTFYAMRNLKLIRPDVVCVVNEDNFLRVFLFRKIFYKYLVCDFYDSHADRFSEKPWLIRTPINAVSFFCKRICDRLVVTDWLRYERLGQFKQKTSIIQNVPEDPGASLAQHLPVGATKIYFSGAMSRVRGLEQLLNAAESCPDLQIIATGRPSDSFAESIFLKHKQVNYRGVVTPQESLELAAKCDAIFAFYAPISQNQIFASPNKLFDAMSVGRPVILNSEVKISRWAAEKSLGLFCSYNDVESLRTLLKSLPGRRADLKDFAAAARRRYLADHCWATMESVLDKLYLSIGDDDTIERLRDSRS